MAYRHAMRLHQFLNRFSSSLAQQDWHAVALEQHLVRRLPPRLRRLARPVSRALIRAFPLGVAPDSRQITRFLSARPETGRLWKFARATGSLPQLPLDPPRFRPDPHLPELALPRLATRADLAEWLGLTPEQLTRFADLRGLSALSASAFGPHYLQHLRPKSDGSLRLIEEPRPFLKRLQRRILADLLSQAPPHPAATGFRRHICCIQGAARHAGEQMLVCFDLRHFFPSVALPRIYALFRTLGYPAPVARDLAGLCTAITPPAVLHRPGLSARDQLSMRHLPQGAPSSPALANLAAFRLDTRLAGLARRLSANYSRYADDLAFSGDAPIAPILLRAVPQIVAEEGFALNPAKTRATPAHRRQMVTGLVVNRRVNLPRAEYDRLKAILHHLARPDDPRRADPAFLAQLSGRIAWAEQVNPQRGARLRARLDAILAPRTG